MIRSQLTLNRITMILQGSTSNIRRSTTVIQHGMLCSSGTSLNNEASIQKMRLMKQKSDNNPYLKWLGVTKKHSSYRLRTERQGRTTSSGRGDTDIVYEAYDTFLDTALEWLHAALESTALALVSCLFACDLPSHRRLQRRCKDAE